MLCGVSQLVSYDKKGFYVYLGLMVSKRYCLYNVISDEENPNIYNI